MGELAIALTFAALIAFAIFVSFELNRIEKKLDDHIALHTDAESRPESEEGWDE
jgi:hypothetical protein